MSKTSKRIKHITDIEDRIKVRVRKPILNKEIDRFCDIIKNDEIDLKKIITECLNRSRKVEGFYNLKSSIYGRNETLSLNPTILDIILGLQEKLFEKELFNGKLYEYVDSPFNIWLYLNEKEVERRVPSISFNPPSISFNPNEYDELVDDDTKELRIIMNELMMMDNTSYNKVHKVVGGVINNGDDLTTEIESYIFNNVKSREV